MTCRRHDPLMESVFRSCPGLLQNKSASKWQVKTSKDEQRQVKTCLPISCRLRTASLTDSSSGLSNTWDKKSTAYKHQKWWAINKYKIEEKCKYRYKKEQGKNYSCTFEFGLWILACTTKLSSGMRRISGMGKGGMDSSCFLEKRW